MFFIHRNLSCLKYHKNDKNVHKSDLIIWYLVILIKDRSKPNGGIRIWVQYWIADKEVFKLCMNYYYYKLSNDVCVMLYRNSAIILLLWLLCKYLDSLKSSSLLYFLFLNIILNSETDWKIKLNYLLRLPIVLIEFRLTLSIYVYQVCIVYIRYNISANWTLSFRGNFV